ncbi:MAG TPA: hypothetical protein VGM14_23450 [Streptosporangiaceae bacterium]|jgi:hypothetical protein
MRFQHSALIWRDFPDLVPCALAGLKPTQYRCASESLLRRFRKEGSLPNLHPAAEADVPALMGTISGDITAAWSVKPTSALLTAADSRFDFS